MPEKPQWDSPEQENIACEAIAEEVSKHASSATAQGDGMRLAAATIAARIRQRRLDRGPSSESTF